MYLLEILLINISHVFESGGYTDWTYLMKVWLLSSQDNMVASHIFW